MQISQQVRDKLASSQQDSGAKLTVIVDQAPFVQHSIKSLTTEGLLGLVMAVIVILVFLLSVRSTLVTAVSIPLSVLIALIALWLGDYSLNLLTLGALTIAVGRVVDDSIVVLENIKRHLEYGEEKVHAITSARPGGGRRGDRVDADHGRRVRRRSPLVGGLVGQLFSPFAITVTVALLASLLVSPDRGAGAGVLVPQAAAGRRRRPRRSAEAAEEKERRSPLQRAYLPVIRFATKRRLDHRADRRPRAGRHLGFLATGLKTNFLDQSGQDTLSITQTLPVGTSLAATDAAAKQVEAVLAEPVRREDLPGHGRQRGLQPVRRLERRQHAPASTWPSSDKADATKVGDQLRSRVRRSMSGLGEVKIGDDSSGLGGSQLSVDVQAADAGRARRRPPSRCARRWPGSAGVTDVEHHAGGERAPARRRGQARRGGRATGSPRRRSGRRWRPRSGPRRPAGSPSTAPAQDVVISFGTAAGRPGRAQGAADQHAPRPAWCGSTRSPTVNQVDGPEQVTRVDGNRSASVTGTVTGSNVGKATIAELKKKLTALTLPGGASYSLGGVSADQADAFKQLGLAVLAAIAIVFIIMVATFRSLIQPVILLVSIPFAATGAIVLLLITGTPLGVPSLIGVLMLVGIVVTNAIVLMDLINHYRLQGMGVQEAVIEGGRHRLRPILMTAIATIFALLPMALGLTGEGGFISQPLAIVVIGGLVSSTLLTLVLVPTLYTMVENRKEKSRAKRAARRARKAGRRPRRAKHAAEARTTTRSRPASRCRRPAAARTRRRRTAPSPAARCAATPISSRCSR